MKRPQQWSMLHRAAIMNKHLDRSRKTTSGQALSQFQVKTSKANHGKIRQAGDTDGKQNTQMGKEEGTEVPGEVNSSSTTSWPSFAGEHLLLPAYPPVLWGCRPDQFPPVFFSAKTMKFQPCH